MCNWVKKKVQNFRTSMCTTPDQRGRIHDSRSKRPDTRLKMKKRSQGFSILPYQHFREKYNVLNVQIFFLNLESTGVHDGMGVERWLGWSPPSFIQIGPKLSKCVFVVVSGWVGWFLGGLNIPPDMFILIYYYST